jgi:hypothetical protein
VWEKCTVVYIKDDATYSNYQDLNGWQNAENLADSSKEDDLEGNATCTSVSSTDCSFTPTPTSTDPPPPSLTDANDG